MTKSRNSQGFGQRRQRELTWFGLGKDSLTRQGTQESEQGVKVRGCGCGQFFDRPGSALELVGDPEFRGGVNRL